MTRLLPLFYLVSLCLFQFSVVSSAQFLPLESEDMETEFNIEEYSPFEEEQQLVVLTENTPQEIGTAISHNTAAVLKLFFELYSEDFQIQAGREQNARDKDLNWLGSDVFRSVVGYSDVIGDALGTLATNIISSFQDAQANREDVGVAVGATAVDALETLNDHAYPIVNILQQAIDESISKSRYLPEDYVVIFRGAGGAIERFINTINNNALTIGDLVAKAVNTAITQSESPADLLGLVATRVFQGIADNVEVASKIMDDATTNALSGIDGIAQTDIDKARERVQKMTKEVNSQSWIDFGRILGQVITNGIKGAKTVGFNREGEAKDPVEVINRIGDTIRQGMEKVKANI